MEQQTATKRRVSDIVPLLNRRLEGWRKTDPEPKEVCELTPEDFGARVVIRSGEFLGTVCGTLMDVYAHSALVHFTCVQLSGKKLLTFRNDIEVIVMESLPMRSSV